MSGNVGVGRMRAPFICLMAVGTVLATGVSASSQDRLAGCESGGQAGLCLRLDDTVPDKYRPLFTDAGTAAVRAVASSEFRADLAEFIQRRAPANSRDPWWGVDATATADRVHAELLDFSVTTYGGLYGWFLNTFWGNLAYDGGGGPVRLNRAGLPRSMPSVANTFAHEAAHRVGLRHPSSNDDLNLAECEPPYVIGSLVEKHAQGTSWRPGESDCADLADVGSGRR